MSNHTKEPWVLDALGAIRCGEDGYLELNIDNCKRIVACVNACAGIPTNELEYISGSDREKASGIIRHHWDACHLRIQRDELLSVMKDFTEWNKKYPSSRIYSEHFVRIIGLELDAIASAAEKVVASVEGK